MGAPKRAEPNRAAIKAAEVGKAPPSATPARQQATSRDEKVGMNVKNVRDTIMHTVAYRSRNFRFIRSEKMPAAILVMAAQMENAVTNSAAVAANPSAVP